MSEVETSAAPAEIAPNTEVVTQEETPNIEGVSSEQKQAIATLKEKFKLTVDGEEFEEEVDWNDKADITRRLQLAKAAQKRMSEAKDAKTKAFDIVKAFESDPASILKRLGPKGRDAAEKFLLEQIQDDMLTPEEKEYRMTKAELAKYKAKDAETAEAAEKSAKSAQENKYAQEFQTTIIEALTKSGLPKSPELVKRMAGVLSKNLELGLDLTADDLVVEVKRDILELVKSVTKDADGDQLEAIFGKDVANKIRKNDLKKLQDKQDQVFQRPESRPAPTRQTKSDRPMSIDQWKETINERIK